MNILDFENITKNTKEIGINKNANMVGNYNIKLYDFNLNKWVILSIKTYQDALSFAFMAGFQNVKHETNNRIILARG